MAYLHVMKQVDPNNPPVWMRSSWWFAVVALGGGIAIIGYVQRYGWPF